MEIEIPLLKIPAFTLHDLWKLALPHVEFYSFSQYSPCWARLQLPLPGPQSLAFSLLKDREKFSSALIINLEDLTGILAK